MPKSFQGHRFVGQGASSNSAFAAAQSVLKEELMMRKKVFATVIIFIFVLGAGICYWFYPRFFSPIYELKTNIPIEGQSSVTSRLIANDGSVYWEEKGADPSNYKFGRQIGRAPDGPFQIFEIKGDTNHNEIMLTGFMFPQIIYKRE